MADISFFYSSLEDLKFTLRASCLQKHWQFVFLSVFSVRLHSRDARNASLIRVVPGVRRTAHWSLHAFAGVRGRRRGEADDTCLSAA